MKMYLLQAVPDSSQATNFWAENGDTILVGVITGVVTAIIVLVFSEPIKGLFKKIGEHIERRLQGFGWRFKKKYLAALAQDHQRLQLIGFTDKVHPPLLKEVYVSLQMRASFNEEARRFNWYQLFAGKENKIVVLGQPGSGKSTLMDYLTLIFSKHLEHPLAESLGDPVPLFVRLRDVGRVRNSKPVTLMDLLQNPDSLANADTPVRFFERLLKAGRCILLLDGLDEVLDHRQHNEVVRAIQRITYEYPDNRFVVTCRVAGWDNQLPNFQVFEVQPFEPADIRKFISAWYREVLRTRALNALGPGPSEREREETLKKSSVRAREQAERLWVALQDKDDLLRIARTPLILSLITLVYYSDQARLPSGRTRLYQRCLEILLDEWDWKDKQLSLPDSPSLDDKLRVMKAIAIHYLEAQVLDMDRSGLEDLVAPIVPRLNTSIDAESLIDHIIKRSGILQEKSIGRFGFAHRALHDYLAAKVIEEQQRDQVLLKHVDEEPWREIILITAALVPDERTETLVKALYDTGRENINSIIMAGWTLAEDIHIDPKLRHAILEALCLRLEENTEAGTFVRLMESLLAASRDRALTWMQEALRAGNDAQAGRIVEFIPDLGDTQANSFASVLVELVKGADRADTRVLAAQALSGLSCELDASTWEVLEEARRDPNGAVRQAATWAWCELGRYDELGFVKVEEGEFTMGSTENEDEKPVHTVYVSTFYIAKSPVTVREYRAFVQGSGYEPDGFLDQWNRRDDHPAVTISWYDAQAYASHYGFALPSEPEWEKAARGTDERRYPWGNEWDRSLCNSHAYWGFGRNWKFWKRSGDTTPVGSFSPKGDSPYDCVDMAGNVWEWTRSQYAAYPYDAKDGREALPVKKAEEASEEGPRVLRGGSFVSYYNLVRCASRYWNDPDNPYDFRGFRLVALPPSD